MKKAEHRTIYFSESTLTQLREFTSVTRKTRSQAIRELISTGYGLWKRSLTEAATIKKISEENRVSPSMLGVEKN